MGLSCARDISKDGPVLIATMHGKERVIGPLLHRFLGLHARPTTSLDTDRFGSFSREIARTGTATHAAAAKIAAARSLHPRARLVLASEGSFRPHPLIPGLAIQHELLMLDDMAAGPPLIAETSRLFSHHQHRLCHGIGEVEHFARALGFPAQGVLLMPPGGRPARKNLDSWPALLAAAAGMIVAHGAVHVETDLRAHRSPQRRRGIARAALRLIRKALSPCPACRQPGFTPDHPEPGLPCALCGTPTAVAQARISRCQACHHSARTPLPARTASAGHCPQCNP